jgi:hypothetical protein
VKQLRNHGNANGFRQIPRVKPLNHAKTVKLHRAHAKAEFNRLGRASFRQAIENLSFPEAEPSDPRSWGITVTAAW